MTGAGKDRLEEILAHDPHAERARVRERFDALFEGREGRVILCGAGSLGESVLVGFRAFGVEPLAFTDRNPARHGQVIQGVPVMSLEEAVERFGDNAVFVPAVYTNGPMLATLGRLGVRILPLSYALWRNVECFRWCWPEFFPLGTAPCAQAIRDVYELLEDEPSRAEFLGQLAWRTTLDLEHLPPHAPFEELYFPRDLITLVEEEVFVDCGACDGDTLRAYYERMPQGPRRFVGIEPDPVNAARLAAFLETLPGLQASIERSVLGGQAGTTRFSASGDCNSLVHERGVPTPVRPLDEVLRGITPTLIKMDIEGAEGDALDGCRETIRRCHPKLAIALYHRPQDLWELPLKIHRMAPAYRIHLRRHSNDCWEEVCYALPR